ELTRKDVPSCMPAIVIVGQVVDVVGGDVLVDVDVLVEVDVDVEVEVLLDVDVEVLVEVDVLVVVVVVKQLMETVFAMPTSSVAVGLSCRVPLASTRARLMAGQLQPPPLTMPMVQFCGG